MADTPWPLIHAERRALIEDLHGLTAEQWDVPSLCTGWSVRQVLGHLTATARMTPGRFLRHFAGAGFRFDAMTAKDVANETSMPPEKQLVVFESLAGTSTAPPGPADSMLGEIVVHAQDIRRPLGIARDCPPAVAVRVADFYRGSNLVVGAKRRIAGVTLRATDADWSTGEGPVVSGPIVSLVMLMTGRPADAALSGPGLARFAPGSAG